MNLLAAAAALIHRLRHPFPDTAMNAVHAITAYYDPNLELWMFDEPRYGLEAEPFVHGATEAIDRALERKYGRRPSRCIITFSADPLPDPDCIARRIGDGVGAERTGSLYWDCSETGGRHPRTLAEKLDRQLWLCPALCHFFGKRAPEAIYATFKLPRRKPET